MKRRLDLTIALTFSLLTTSIAAAAAVSDTAPLSVRIYSSVCQYHRAGNIEGMRIVLVHSFDGDVALLDMTEQGGFDEPLASKAKLNVRTHSITFAMKSEDHLWDIRFDGKVDDRAIVGTLHMKRPGPVDEPVHIKRLRGDREDVSACTDEPR